MTMEEVHQKTAAWLAGNMPGEEAEQFLALLQESSSLRDAVQEYVFGLLLSERAEENDLLKRMKEWEENIDPLETLETTDMARLEQLLLERQDETELLHKMDAWEAKIDDKPPKSRFIAWIGIVALIFVFILLAILKWSRPGESQAPAPKSVIPKTSPALPAPSEDTSAPVAPKQLPGAPAQHQYIALAESRYNQWRISADGLRSLQNAPFDSLKNAVLEAYEKQDWSRTIKAINRLLRQLPPEEQAEYWKLLGGAYFEKGDYANAASVFSNSTLKESSRLRYDAQLYELLSRLAVWPNDRAVLKNLFLLILSDPENPNYATVNGILDQVPELDKQLNTRAPYHR